MSAIQKAPSGNGSRPRRINPEAIAMPMLDEYSVALTETTDRFVTFDDLAGVVGRVR